MARNFLCNRRTVLAGASAAAGLRGLPIGAMAMTWASIPQDNRPTFAYFNDTLLSDPTGQLPAYRRPTGYHGARGIARMTIAGRIRFLGQA